MFKLLRSFFRHYRQIAAIASLTLATLLCLGLFVLRAAHSHSFTHSGLLWNLFLAWLPAGAALLAYNIYKRRSWLRWLVTPASALVWLIFLPNAPYLLTDIVHLQEQPGVPYWYDLIMFLAFAWTGFFLGLVSLFLMQEIVRRSTGGIASWVFAFGVVGLSSFGIYLGRFLRWNSWDILLRPKPILLEVWAQVRHPLANFQTFAFSLLFAFFFLCMYLLFIAVMHFRQEAQRSDSWT